MTSKTSKYAISAAAAAILVVTGVVRADDGDGGQMVLVSYASGEEAGSPSCSELREIAKIVVEMERTDGDVTPTATQVTCRDEVYAQSTVDAD
jgi:hypothetical protein